MKKFLMAAVAAATLMSVASGAQAAVSIGYSTGGPITTASDLDPSPDSWVSSFVAGVFSVNVVSATLGVDPTLLTSTTNNTATGAGTLEVYVTRDGITGAIPDFLNGYTTNLLTAGWSVTLETFVDAANGLWGGTPVGSATFTGIDTDSTFGAGPNGAGPYSVTQKYTIVASKAGSNLSTITTAAVPEPGTWALMIGGFGAAGAMLRRKRALALA